MTANTLPPVPPAGVPGNPLPKQRPGWKTYAGALLIVLGALCSPEVLAVMPENVAHVLQAIGAALGLVGLRGAQSVTESKTDSLIYRQQEPPINPLLGRRG